MMEHILNSQSTMNGLRAVSQWWWKWLISPVKVITVRVRAETGNHALHSQSRALSTHPNRSGFLKEILPSSSHPPYSHPHHGGGVYGGQCRTTKFTETQQPVSLGPQAAEQQHPAPALGSSWLWSLVPSSLLPPCAQTAPSPNAHTSPHALHVGCWGEYKLDKSPSNSGN